MQYAWVIGAGGGQEDPMDEGLILGRLRPGKFFGLKCHPPNVEAGYILDRRGVIRYRQPKCSGN